MDPTTMVKLAAGKDLIGKLLPGSGFPVTAAAWMQLYEDPSLPRLALVSPSVDDLGTRKAYERLREILDSACPKSLISPSDVILLRPTETAAKALDTIVEAMSRRQPTVTEPFAWGGWIGSFHPVEDAYVYPAACYATEHANP